MFRVFMVGSTLGKPCVHLCTCNNFFSIFFLSLVSRLVWVVSSFPPVWSTSRLTVPSAARPSSASPWPAPCSSWSSWPCSSPTSASRARATWRWRGSRCRWTTWNPEWPSSAKRVRSQQVAHCEEFPVFCCGARTRGQRFLNVLFATMVIDKCTQSPHLCLVTRNLVRENWKSTFVRRSLSGVTVTWHLQNQSADEEVKK